MNIDSVLQTFIVESRELLADMENALLGLGGQETESEALNAIFRAAHTIKGSSGLFGLDHIVEFTHVAESVLDTARAGKLILGSDLVALLLECCDHIGCLIERVATGNLDADAELAAHGRPLIERMLAFQSTSPHGADPTAVPAVSPAEHATPPAGADHWHISLRFGTEVLRNGMDPLSFIRYLGTLGTIASIVPVTDALLPLTELDPESCHLGFEIRYVSDADKTTIENVFEFVRDDCSVRILPPHSRIDEYVRLIEALPEESVRIGEILIRCGSLTRHELELALDTQTAAAAAVPIGEILVDQGSVRPAVVEAAAQKQNHAERKSQENHSIRIDAEKLDALINRVGELVIIGESANLIARRLDAADLQECTSRLTSLVEEIRDNALELRMVKIGATFNRFQRVVHDVSRELKKDIGLIVSGEDTELDKTVVEKIADPLTHLVRNAIDHGIEPADVRAAHGKPSRGTVTLNAHHDSGTIVIEVSDDGGGLKRERILAKALDRGLIEPNRILTDTEVFDLVFEPGFSTAEAVTNLSGRGVGMDVVKRNITALRGSVSIASTEGVGTTVSVRLPLTLAIIDGFLVGLGSSVFVVPLDVIEECIEYSAEPGLDYANLRGQVLPFVRLREALNVAGAPSKRQNVIVVRHAGRRFGLVVDTLLGEFQTVIKPLAPMFNGLTFLSGSTILGSGEVALILDVPSLVQSRFAHKDAGAFA